MRKEFAPALVLSNWRRVVEAIPEMNEKELEASLAREKKTAKRKDVVFRLARRLAYLKARRQPTATATALAETAVNA